MPLLKGLRSCHRRALRLDGPPKMNPLFFAILCKAWCRSFLDARRSSDDNGTSFPWLEGWNPLEPNGTIPSGFHVNVSHSQNMTRNGTNGTNGTNGPRPNEFQMEFTPPGMSNLSALGEDPLVPLDGSSVQYPPPKFALDFCGSDVSRMTKCYTWISKYNGCRDRCAFKATTDRSNQSNDGL